MMDFSNTCCNYLIMGSKANRTCCVRGCNQATSQWMANDENNPYTKAIFHSLPRQKEIRSQWLHSLQSWNGIDWSPKADTRVCSVSISHSMCTLETHFIYVPYTVYFIYASYINYICSIYNLYMCHILFYIRNIYVKYMLNIYGTYYISHICSVYNLYMSHIYFLYNIHICSPAERVQHICITYVFFMFIF